MSKKPYFSAEDYKEIYELALQEKCLCLSSVINTCKGKVNNGEVVQVNNSRKLCCPKKCHESLDKYLDHSFYQLDNGTLIWQNLRAAIFYGAIVSSSPKSFLDFFDSFEKLNTMTMSSISRMDKLVGEVKEVNNIIDDI
jgi:hypothetical protein